MKNAFGIILQQDQLNWLGDQKAFSEFPCHIYMITRHPRVCIDPKTIVIDSNYITGKFEIQYRDKFIPRPFKARNDFGTTDIHLRSNYPYTSFEFVTGAGEVIFDGKAALVLMSIDPMFSLDLEVLYVGQSYGIEGARTAPGRLLSHSTLQQIYAEAIGSSPDQEIWLVLLSFEEPFLLMSFDGRSGEYGTSDEEDDYHMKKVMSSEITEQQRINYTEAALIRYFEPEYNKTYKYNFPNPAHRTYSECYDVDLNTVAVELQTEELRCRLWSPTVSKEWIHFVTFPLHSAELRRGMFEIC